MGILTRGSGGNELTLKPKRDIRLKLGFSDKGCVSCCYCDKLPPLNGLNINDIQCYLELNKFRRSEGQNGSYWANVKVLTDLHSFLEALGDNPGVAEPRWHDLSNGQGGHNYHSKPGMTQTGMQGSVPVTT